MDGNNTRIALNRKNNTADTAIVKTLTLQLFADPPQKFLPHSALAYSPNRRYIAGPVPWQTVSPSLISIEVYHSQGMKLSVVDKALRYCPMDQGASEEIAGVHSS
jgi:hypothetical protein